MSFKRSFWHFVLFYSSWAKYLSRDIAVYNQCISRFFGENYCCKTMKVTIMQISTVESTLISAISICYKKMISAIFLYQQFLLKGKLKQIFR